MKSTRQAFLQEEVELAAAAWKLYDLGWQLITTLHKTADGGVGSAGLDDPKRHAAQLPAIAGFALGAMPFGLDKHLASLPIVGRQEGRYHG